MEQGLLMKKIHKKSIVMLVAIIVCISCLFQNEKETYASNSNKYLVLVQQKNGSWKEYEHMIEESSSGNLMIKAKLLSKELGFTYKNTGNGTFVIKRSSTRYNTYTKKNAKFTYTNKSVNSIKLASNIAYTSTTSKHNVCQVNSLSTLVNYKYFNSTTTKDYLNYSGVICYSKYKKIPSTAPTSDPGPTKKPTPTPKPEPTSINIEGVVFPVRDSFLPVDKALSDWGGTAIIWYELEQAVDSKIIDTTDLIIGSNKIEFSHLGVSGSDGVYLTKASKGYKISISVKLDGSVLANQNAAIVKALVATISSKPYMIYTAIFESFTTDDTNGIKEDNYVTIGDCKVKVEIKAGKVIYYIKEA